MATTKDATKATKPRHSLHAQLKFALSPARISRWMNRLGMNYSPCLEITKVNNKLQEMQKAGGPVHPGLPPKRPGKDAPTTEYTQQVETHKKALDEWKAYEHPAFTKLYTAYCFYKLAQKLVELLCRKEQTERVREEQATILTIMSDKPAPQGRNESEEKYKKRTETFVAPGYKVLAEAASISVASAAGPDPNKVTAALNKMRTDMPDLNLFLEKDNMSHQKIRFNDEGLIGITTCCEYIVTECVRHAMVNANDDGKKIIRPDHIIMTDGIFKSPYYPLFRNLPHFVALVERFDRSVLHEAQTKEKRNALFRDARAKAHNSGHQYRKADSPDLSVLKRFEEDEVEHGFAIKREHQLPKKKGATVAEVAVEYLWKGIDVDDDDDVKDNTNFDHYVGLLCNSTKSAVFSDINVAESIKISKSIRQFLTRMITDFLARLAPQFRVLLDYNNVKTIDLNTVQTAFRLALSNDYFKRDGIITWTKPHEALFATIDERVNTWKTFTSSGKEVQDDELDEADMDALGDIDEDDEEEPEASADAVESTAATPAPAAPAPVAPVAPVGSNNSSTIVGLRQKAQRRR